VKKVIDQTLNVCNMKKMNLIKGLAAGMLTLAGFTVAAQTDTSVKRTDSVQTHTEAQIKQDYTIIDLSTNAPIDIYYDSVTFRTINRTTTLPVEFYVINSIDTVHGVTGLVVNGMLMKAADGKYLLNDGFVKIDGDEIKMKMADGRKVKWENGKIKVKEWGEKRKHKTDKDKMKNEWGKVRWKEGEWKIEKDS
jgi:hypothetical protein